MIKLLKKKFKTVYCSDCKNKMKKTNLWRQNLCEAYPYVEEIDTSTLINRGEKKIISTYHSCKQKKRNSFCFRYKEKTHG